MEEGFKFQLKGKMYSVPAGWSVDNWSGRNVVLDDNTGIEPRGELHLVFRGLRRKIVHAVGDEDHLLGTPDKTTTVLDDRRVTEGPYMDHTCSYMFVTTEMATILSEMDLESQEIVLFGVDHRGKVTHIY